MGAIKYSPRKMAPAVCMSCRDSLSCPWTPREWFSGQRGGSCCQAPLLPWERGLWISSSELGRTSAVQHPGFRPGPSFPHFQPSDWAVTQLQFSHLWNGTILLCSIVLEVTKGKHLVQCPTSRLCWRNRSWFFLLQWSPLQCGFWNNHVPSSHRDPTHAVPSAGTLFLPPVTRGLFPLQLNSPISETLSCLSNYKSSHSGRLLLEKLCSSFLVPLQVVMRSIRVCACLMSVCLSGLQAPDELRRPARARVLRQVGLSGGTGRRPL